MRNGGATEQRATLKGQLSTCKIQKEIHEQDPWLGFVVTFRQEVDSQSII